MSSNSEPHLHIGVLSHPGEKRTNNEDSYSVFANRLEKDSMPTLLAIVADGIGGHQAGEIASQLTIDTIVDKLSRADADQPLHHLRSAIKTAGTTVAQAALRSQEFYGMGSTVAVAWVIGKQLYTAHVGDSRIYLLRNNSLSQITIDHTWVQEAIKHEIISPEEARNHPRAHVLQLAIGSPDPPEPDFRLRLSDQENDLQSENNQGMTLIQGDKILLCTDGLTDLVEDHEIQMALAEQIPQDAAQSLVSLARARGGHDNITVIILAVPRDWSDTQSKRTKKNVLLRGAFILFILAVITIALIAALWLDILPWFHRDATTSTPASGEYTPSSSATLPSSDASPQSIEGEYLVPTLTTTPAPTSTAIPLPTIESEEG
jgi:serine/threonine protein phosphatase PrpC